MKYLKNSYQLIKYNFGTLLKFELIFKILVGLVFMPIVTAGFRLSMKLTGHSYLTMENIAGFILNPITLILILLAIIFLSLITVFDIGTMLIIYDASYHKKKITLVESIKISVKKCKKLFNLKNFGVAFLVLFLIPILDIGVRTNVITAIKIPEFIEDFIVKNNFLSWALLAIYIFLTFILAKWIFSLHYMILEEKDFKEARKSSNQLSKGYKIKDFVKVILFEIILTASYFLIVYTSIELIKMIKYTLANYVILASILITIIALCFVIAFIVFIILSNSIAYAIISVCFYDYKKEKKEKIAELEYSNPSKKKKYILKIIMLTILVTSIGLVSYNYVKGEIIFTIMVEQNTEVTAHRGESTNHPENTMSAFAGAKEVEADWIELDVQQTKDRQIVVSHDSNLARVTGVNKDIIDMTYEEISKLDAGSFFNEKFKGEKIPLLEDVLKFAKENNMKLNIELKPVGKEVDFEKQVIELIKKYEFEKQCVVTSMVYNVLENTKKIDSNIQTLYVMTVAIGDITDLEYADSFSVEETNANYELLEKVHKQGKKLFVWTVNNEENINSMIDLGVDNIITDNCPLCKELIEKRKKINIVKELIDVMAK